MQVYGEHDYLHWRLHEAHPADDPNSAMQRTIKRVPPGPLLKPLAQPPAPEVLQDLMTRFPNHVQALEFVRDQVALSSGG